MNQILQQMKYYLVHQTLFCLIKYVIIFTHHLFIIFDPVNTYVLINIPIVHSLNSIHMNGEI